MHDYQLDQHTPLLSCIDGRGIAVRAVAYHRLDLQPPSRRLTLQNLSAVNRRVQQWDSRLSALAVSNPNVIPNQQKLFSLTGRLLRTDSVDAGWQSHFSDVNGQLRDSNEGRGTRQRLQYDENLRLMAIFERERGTPAEHCLERFSYAKTDNAEATLNRCGQLIRHDDPAGSQWHNGFNIQGQELKDARRFCLESTAPNWPLTASDCDLLLEEPDKTYATRWQYDALGAVIGQTDAAANVHAFFSDVAGQSCSASLNDINVLKSTFYDAFGRVEHELAGNDVVTERAFSAIDGRLHCLKSHQLVGKVLQDIHYQYDSVGNIQRIEDRAQSTQWYAQEQIAAVNTYTYDTLYQLVSATGRESASHNLGPGLPGLEIMGKPDDSRWRNYTQNYTYDEGGNLTDLQHAAAGYVFHREMVVAEFSNRSLYKDGSVPDFTKRFDANGNQLALLAGQTMLWNGRNQLAEVTQVVRDEAIGLDDDFERYVYDGNGQRLRKVRNARIRSGEKINDVRYLPGLEIRFVNNNEQLQVCSAQAGSNNVRLLHWQAGRPTQIANDQLRYSLSDHLGSSTLELDDVGELLSHESYYPFGGTAWWAARNAIEAKYKVMRYSGKELDATGLYYYGFRYYAPSLQRWISPDPAGDIDGLNIYVFVGNNPVRYVDANGLTMSKDERRAFVQSVANQLLISSRIVDSDVTPEMWVVNKEKIWNAAEKTLSDSGNGEYFERIWKKAKLKYQQQGNQYLRDQQEQMAREMAALKIVNDAKAKSQALASRALSLIYQTNSGHNKIKSSYDPSYIKTRHEGGSPVEQIKRTDPGFFNDTMTPGLEAAIKWQLKPEAGNLAANFLATRKFEPKTKLFRGDSNLDPSQFKELAETAGMYKAPNFLSSSTEQKVAERFRAGKGVLLHLSGKAAPVENLFGESEYVFAPGSQFNVTATKEKHVFILKQCR